MEYIVCAHIAEEWAMNYFERFVFGVCLFIVLWLLLAIIADTITGDLNSRPNNKNKDNKEI